MKKAVAVLGVLLSSNAIAQYQFELDAGVTHVEAEENDSLSGKFNDGFEEFDLSATYHFAPVAIENVALSDAAFLAQSSWVKIGRQESNFVEWDESSKGIETQWVTASKIVLGFSYLEQELETSNFRDSMKGPGIKVGQYISESSMIALQYHSLKNRFDADGYFYDSTESDRETYILSFKNVVTVDGQANTDIEVELEKTNEFVAVSSKIGWYSGNNIKYGVAAGIQDFDQGYRSDRRRFSVWGEWFVLQNLAVNAEYETMRAQSGGFDEEFRFQENSVRLGLISRF